MLASFKLLNQFVDLSSVTPQQVADKLTFAGLEVEDITYLARGSNLIIGQILSVENHPDSNHLHVLQVDEGKEGIHQIVCGAPNVKVGLKVIVARVGAYLPAKDITITKSVIRGVESDGMCCSLTELGVDKTYLSEYQINGIEELDEDAPIGETNVLGYLGLDDAILDINVLANRADCLAIYSIAKEVASLFGKEIKIPAITRYEEVPTSLDVTSSTPLCPQFSIKVVRDVVTKPSPKWLSNFLMAQGIRSINNIVDIGNYVMVLTGQPLHMYDEDKLPTLHYDVRDDFEGDVIALDGKTYHLQKGDIVVTTSGTPVCLAGTMGLQVVAIDDDTKNIVIEAANFKGSSVRKTSNRIGLSSESSARFIKGINPYQDEDVLNFTAQLLVELADAKIISQNVRYSTLGKNETRIACSISYINNRLGTTFSKEQIIDVLNKLYIQVEFIDEDNFVAIPPDHRIDLKRDADLSEEVIRYIGFGAIKSQLPQMVTTTGGYSTAQKKRYDIRNLLIDLGLHEVLTYALISPKMNEEFVLLNQDEPYVVANPMTLEHSVVRRGLVSSLVETIKYNLDHQQKDLAFFEVSQIDTKNSNFQELAIILNGNKSERGELQTRPYDFYDVHGLLESILAYLGIEPTRYKEARLTTSPFYHPGRTTQIILQGEVVGVCGEIHPNYSKGIKRTYVLDLNLTKLLNVKTSLTKMATISKFPSVTRDLALVVSKDVLASDMVRTIKKNGKSLVKDVTIFDVYQGEFLRSDSKSIAFSITYQDDTKTLNDATITSIEDAIIKALNKEYHAELRK